jgi:hypothetical protein
MYWPAQPLALEAAKRILNRGNDVDYSDGGTRILTDLTELIRRDLTGEELLEESSQPYHSFPALISCSPSYASSTAKISRP